ncbi:MAG TPA: hypothetical protein PLW02_12660, partial [Verrucomicrobiota bacterium]|nr:hypothetical protein [Verrucomicrobiota bacterium]
MILGNWVFNLKSTLYQIRKSTPKMTRAQALFIERSYTTNIESARITALIDKQIILRITDKRNSIQTFKGTWEKTGPGSYTANWSGGNISKEIEVEPDRLTIRKDNKLMVFEPEY